MSKSAFQHTPLLDIDCMARIGANKHSIMGIRFHTGDPANPPSQSAPNPTPPGATPPATTPPPATDPAPKADETPPAINKATGKPYTPAETQEYITKIRGEAKENREKFETEKQRADAAEARSNEILKAAGFNPDGTPYSEIDPEKVTADKAKSDAERDNTKRENLVLRVAGKVSIGADADRLLDSRAFTDKLSSIAVDDKDGVETLIKEWIEKDPSYKVTSAAASSGGTTHTGTTPPSGRKSMADAVDAKYKTP